MLQVTRIVSVAFIRCGSTLKGRRNISNCFSEDPHQGSFDVVVRMFCMRETGLIEHHLVHCRNSPDEIMFHCPLIIFNVKRKIVVAD